MEYKKYDLKKKRMKRALTYRLIEYTNTKTDVLRSGKADNFTACDRVSRQLPTMVRQDFLFRHHIERSIFFSHSCLLSFVRGSGFIPGKIPLIPWTCSS